MSGALILVINAGSSSIKTALFDSDLREHLRVDATGIGDRSRITSSRGMVRQTDLPDHAAALVAIFDVLEAQEISGTRLRAAAHRVVHGGRTLTEATRITSAVRDEIAACVPLAPLHNPHHLSAMDTVAQRMPDLPQIASFDTAFHATNPDVARRYALPNRTETEALQRYGFHGISYAALVHDFEGRTGETLPTRLLALHLGNGASLCAIRKGQSVATTMGFAPLNGLTMGTRVGEIDAGAVLHLVRRMGAEQAGKLLQDESGLLGLSGRSGDMRTLSAAADDAAVFARAHFTYWIARHAGSMIAAMGGLDGIAFTGGIGENDQGVRDNVLEHLAWAGNSPHWVIPAAEEKHIARQAITVLERGQGS